MNFRILLYFYIFVNLLNKLLKSVYKVEHANLTARFTYINIKENRDKPFLRDQLIFMYV